MSRTGQTFLVAGSALAGMIAGLVGGRLATHGMAANKRATVVLSTTLGGGALGAGIASYASAPSLQLNA
jgi:hypothetical protein